MSNNVEQVVSEVQDAPKGKAKGSKKNANVAVVTTASEASSSNVPSVTQLLELIEQLTTRVSSLEDTVKTLQATPKPQVEPVSKPAKSVEEKKPRAPTAYNLFMKQKMSELKESHPDMSNIDRMKMAAEAWSESKK